MSVIQNVYLAKNKNHSIWKSSSSGGVFLEVAKYIISKQGVVYGVAYNHENNVIHERANTIEECKKFKGSKYVQSDLGDTFKQCRDDLRNDRYVLFTGTPCQIAGLKMFLRSEDTSKLYTQDIVCHGVPSPKFYSKYLDFMEKDLNIKIKNINFRSKVLPNEIQDISIIGEGGKIYKSYGTHDIYYKFFLKNMILRPICYKCKFTSIDRESDITLADYWGKREVLSRKFKDELGISSIFINSEKGEEIWNEIKENFKYEESTIDICMQPNLKEPSKVSIDVEKMWDDFNNNEFDEFIEMYIGSYKKMKNQRILKIFFAQSGILPIYQKLKRRMNK